ncbi:MAG: DUF192 domain-containing protein [bacterium]
MLRLIIILPLLLLLTACDRIISQVVINDQTITVETATTPQEQYQGLSDRDSLCNTCCMLFMVEPNSRPEFVMRNMNFPLDFVWINDDRIIDITKQAQPEGEAVKAIYQASLPVDYVLEINGGQAEVWGWKIGDGVKLKYD